VTGYDCSLKPSDKVLIRAKHLYLKTTVFLTRATFAINIESLKMLLIAQKTLKIKTARAALGDPSAHLQAR